MRAKHILPILLLLATSLAAQLNRAAGEWRRLGPDGGTVGDLVAAPANPKVLYASAQGAFYRSLDGGASWALREENSFTNPATFRLAVDAADPSLVYAVQERLVRSRNGGALWEPLDTPGWPVYQIVAHPRFARTVFAVTADGLFRSTNAGLSWKVFRRGLPARYSATLLVIDPVAPRRLYLAVEEPDTQEKSLFKSLDGGISWQAIDNGPLAGKSLLALATHPRSASVLYASVPEEVFKSTDGGRSWRSADPGASAGRAHLLAVHPGQPEVVYAGTDGGLFRSQNGGATWARQSQGLPESGSILQLLVSRQTLLAAVIAIGRRGGVFRSSDAGSSWVFSSQGIQALNVSVVDFGPPGTIWIVADRILFRSADQGLTWSRVRPNPGTSLPPTAVAVAPTDRSNVFVLYSDGALWRSADSGRTWEAGGDAGLQAIDLAVDPQTPSTLYAAGIPGAAGAGGIARSTDRGTTWAPLPAEPATYYDVDVAPSSPSTLYAAGTDEDFSPIYLRSLDGGASWSRLSFTVQYPVAPPALAVDPLVATTVYATAEGLVHRSTDGGQTWSPVSNTLDSSTIYPLETDPSGRLYAGVWDVGVVSYEGGNPTGAILSRTISWLFLTLAPDPHDPCRVYAGAADRSLMVFTYTGTAGCPAP